MAPGVNPRVNSIFHHLLTSTSAKASALAILPKRIQRAVLIP